MNAHLWLVLIALVLQECADYARKLRSHPNMIERVDLTATYSAFPVITPYSPSQSWSKCLKTANYAALPCGIIKNSDN
ncbi:hypothetical protein [Nostoc sp.]|uniref:hypothetical protein n=1 Tax=Nostoc sp. TaxID=1180 RepID=UPI002FF911DF